MYVLAVCIVLICRLQSLLYYSFTVYLFVFDTVLPYFLGYLSAYQAA